MIQINYYPLAVLMCAVTMLCWGSWANTQKLATREWRFQLYYWDYSIGVVLLSLALAFTMGTLGDAGRPFTEDVLQAGRSAVYSALLGGVIFNLANILLVAAIDVAGMSVAFPIGCGLALVLGTGMNYHLQPKGNVVLLSLGVLSITAAVIFDALAYGRLPSQGSRTTTKGIVLSILAGLLMAFFYPCVAASISNNAGYLGPCTACVFFSVGLFLSSFIWNTLFMRKPVVGAPIPLGDYFTKGNTRLHLAGVLGGIIWGTGMVFNLIAAGPAGFAVAFGLGYGAIMVAGLWGVLVWREFRTAPTGTGILLVLMFGFFVLGLGLIIAAKPA